MLLKEAVVKVRDFLHLKNDYGNAHHDNGL